MAGLFCRLRFQVYVVQDPAGRYDNGLSENVAVRLEQHNSRESRWTKSRRPWTLSWTSEAMSLSEARRRKNGLKRQKVGLVSSGTRG
ncbi:MAG: GIY-YIG nuclease family protein [Opitutaceae bacterium]